MFRQSYVHVLIVFHVIVILQQPMGVPCLTIDNRLVHVADDYYTRLLIGTKISDGDIALRTNVTSLMECEENCSKYKNDCPVFSFGVGVRGNSTCLISTRIPTSENFEVHPDYDVYVKRPNNLAQHYFDRCCEELYPKSENVPKEIKHTREKGTILNIGIPLSESVTSPISVSKPHYMALPSSDDKRFLSVKYSRKSLGINTAKYERTTSVNPSVETCRKNSRSFGPYRAIRPTELAEIITSSILGESRRTCTIRLAHLQNVANCHRKMQAGKKMMNALIERIVDCDNLHDCCWSCDYEESFDCKGFNYRSGDAKCTCELTATPYFRMNVDDDFLVDSRYDYYEKHQNCPSAALEDNVGKPKLENGNRDFGQSGRGTWPNLDHTYEDILSESSTATLDDHFFNSNAQPNRQSTYEYFFDFMPRYPTPNRNRSWKGAVPHTTTVDRNSINNQQLNRHNNYLNVKYPIMLHEQVEHRKWMGELSAPHENGQFHGQFDNYGKEYDHRETYIPITMEPTHEKHENSHRCSFQVVSGTRLSRSVVRNTCFAPDFNLCKDFCINETSFSCESFAYRFSVSTNNPTDNCLLSNLSYRDLNFYTDIEPDQDFDTYAMTSNIEVCKSKEAKVSSRYPVEECFARIRSGFTIPTAVTKKSLFVNDLGECQLACTTSKIFFCTYFVYKYAVAIPRQTLQHVSPNCFLSDCPVEEIHSIDMLDMDGAELYERNTYSYGCDVYHSPSPTATSIAQNDDVIPSIHMDEFCYNKHHASCKLMPHAIAISMRVATMAECRQRCTMMRYTGTIPCSSFNYITTTSTTTPDQATIFNDVQDNCFISDMSIQDLRSNVDYMHNGDHMLYTWTDYDPRCRLMINAQNTINVIPVLDKENQPHILTNYPNHSPNLNYEVSHDALDPNLFAQWKSKFRPTYNKDHYLEYPSVNENSMPLQTSAKQPHDGHNILYPRGQSSLFQRYTVNGHPCKNGTVCQQNRMSGFWSCEIEPGYDSWDYCCQPNHRCGFSKGYHHPWCYVGSNEDQWRPCSETYYPYYSSKNHSVYRQSTFDTGHHWPVIYFHRVSPPNCTTKDDYYKKL